MKKTFVVMLSLLLLPTAASAQTTGRLLGAVSHNPRRKRLVKQTVRLVTKPFSFGQARRNIRLEK